MTDRVTELLVALVRPQVGEAGDLARELLTLEAPSGVADALTEAPSLTPARGSVVPGATFAAIVVASLAVAYASWVIDTAPGVRPGWGWGLPLLAPVVVGALTVVDRRRRHRAEAIDRMNGAVRLGLSLAKLGVPPDLTQDVMAFVYRLTDEQARTLRSARDRSPAAVWALRWMNPPEPPSIELTSAIAGGLVLALALVFWSRYFALVDGGLDPGATVEIVGHER